MTSMVNVREVVLDILMEVFGKQEFSHNVLKQALKKYQYFKYSENVCLPDEIFIQCSKFGSM